MSCDSQTNEIFEVLQRCEKNRPLEEKKHLREAAKILHHLRLFKSVSRFKTPGKGIPRPARLEEVLNPILREWKDKIDVPALVQQDEANAQICLSLLANLTPRLKSEKNRVLLSLGAKDIQEYLTLHVAQSLREWFPELNLPDEILDKVMCNYLDSREKKKTEDSSHL